MSSSQATWPPSSRPGSCGTTRTTTTPSTLSRSSRTAQLGGRGTAKGAGRAKRRAELEKEKAADVPTAMAMTDVGPAVPPTRLLRRGDWRKPGKELAPGFLSAIDERDAEVTPAG